MPGRQNSVTEEALSRLPELDLRQLRELWCRLYKSAAAPRLSRELLTRAVAYRIQELASGGLRPELQRRLHQIALGLQQTGRVTIRPRPQLKPGTRLLREWQGRSHEVLVLDDGFSWQATPLCCTDQQPGEVSPPHPLSCETNVLRPAKRQHAV